MSISTPSIATNASGQAQQGTAGSTISNSSASTLSTNEFLNLMMDQLQNQDPLSPSSSNPTQYLTELAQMTSVEQQTNTAKNTQAAAQAQSVSQAIGLIGDSVTYIDQSNGSKVTGTVASVQITSSGPTLTVGGSSGIALSSLTNVAAASSTSGSGSATTGATTAATGTTTGATTATTGTGTTASTSGSGTPA